ncbi:hypothetical protein IU487_22105 [Nocardia puris]|uniref:hypothetical protein n=1 Tax=Nocardia puris TaxID=208602 RepID=UPI001892F0A2|nr:hypothetical protein [Nocardia puris]MBF6213713.1 hypothetical protein [Nocardia puris]
MTDTNRAIGEWAEGLRAATTPADAITPPDPEAVQARLLDLARQLEWMGATEQAASASAVASDLTELFDSYSHLRADLDLLATYEADRVTARITVADARDRADRAVRSYVNNAHPELPRLAWFLYKRLSVSRPREQIMARAETAEQAQAWVQALGLEPVTESVTGEFQWESPNGHIHLWLDASEVVA